MSAKVVCELSEVEDGYPLKPGEYVVEVDGDTSLIVQAASEEQAAEVAVKECDDENHDEAFIATVKGETEKQFLVTRRPQYTVSARR